MDRIVNTLVRLRDILNNEGAATISTDVFFNYPIDKSVATDFSDGKLRLGLALDTNFGTPLGLLTPFGRINLSESGWVNQAGISKALNVIQREFKADFTNSSALSSIPSGGVDAQLMILGQDADGEALATVAGAETVAGFAKFSRFLERNTPGLQKSSAAVPQASLLQTVTVVAGLGVDSAPPPQTC
jgi:hypothetical protein